jgi:hypothetical protein
MTVLPLNDWRDFFVTIGTASGAIVGAAFVVASLTSGTEKRETGIRGFITPTSVHLGGVLVCSAALTVPVLTPLLFAVLFGAAGLAGIVYGIIVIVRIGHLKLDIPDRFWYCVAPIAAYAVILLSAWVMLSNAVQAIELLAVSLVVLLITGMRNLWDMATFMIMIMTNAKPPDNP